jgi:hypothetical protein
MDQNGLDGVDGSNILQFTTVVLVKVEDIEFTRQFELMKGVQSSLSFQKTRGDCAILSNCDDSASNANLFLSASAAPCLATRDTPLAPQTARTIPEVGAARSLIVSPNHARSSSVPLRVRSKCSWSRRPNDPGCFQDFNQPDTVSPTTSKIPTTGPNCNAYHSREPHATVVECAAKAHSGMHPAASAAPLRSIPSQTSFVPLNLAIIQPPFYPVYYAHLLIMM